MMMHALNNVKGGHYRFLNYCSKKKPAVLHRILHFPTNKVCRPETKLCAGAAPLNLSHCSEEVLKALEESPSSDAAVELALKFRSLKKLCCR